MGKHRCGPRCGCQRPIREVVYPVKENVVNCCTEETVRHVHPSHTTVMNNHLIRNEHVYPHTTSQRYRTNEVDVQGTSTGPGQFGPGQFGPGNAGSPQGGNQVAGAMNQGNQHQHKGCQCRSCRGRNRRF